MYRTIWIFLLWVMPGPVGAFQAGFGSVDITPYDFERYSPSTNRYKIGDSFFDTGTDGRFDFEETGAFGPDSKPGRAGVDDDGDGLIDNCDRVRCEEYLATGTDDRWDPARDNFVPFFNFSGTEGDGQIQFVHLGGFSPFVPFVGNRIANGIRDPIWSRAVVFEAGGRKMVLVSTDLPGFSWKYINPLRRQIQAEFNIPFENIVITSTHNHQAPDAAGYWTTLIPHLHLKFVRRVQRGVLESVRQAHESLRPARWKMASTQHHACRDRLSGDLKYLVDCKIPDSEFDYAKFPDRFDPWVIQRDMRDPVVLNPWIVAIQIEDLQNGNTLGTIVNWHDHPETFEAGNNLISSDFPHYTRQALEAIYGGVSIYFSGTVGCQIGALRGLPVPLWTQDRQPVWEPNGQRSFVTKGEPKVRSLGFEVAHVAHQALDQVQSWERPNSLQVLHRSIQVPVDNPVHQIATRSVWTETVEFPDRLTKTEPQCWLGTLGCVPVDISFLQMGELSFVTSPGEMDPSYLLGRKAVAVDYAERGVVQFPAQPGFGDWMRTPHRVVLGQANHYLSYLIHESDNLGVLNREHPNYYEEMVTIGKSFGDDVGDTIMEMLGSWQRYQR